MEEGLTTKTEKEFQTVTETTDTKAAADEAAAFELNGSALAFIGDAVYSLLVREYCIRSDHSHRAEKLHKMATGAVNAAAQSDAAGLLESHLTEKETAVMKRGRNSKTLTAAKHQSISDYRRATGLEALFGYLYLSGQQDRAIELFGMIAGTLF